MITAVATETYRDKVYNLKLSPRGSHLASMSDAALAYLPTAISGRFIHQDRFNYKDQNIPLTPNNITSA